MNNEVVDGQIGVFFFNNVRSTAFLDCITEYLFIHVKKNLFYHVIVSTFKQHKFRKLFLFYSENSVDSNFNVHLHFFNLTSQCKDTETFLCKYLKYTVILPIIF